MGISPEEVVSVLTAVDQVVGFVGQLSSAAAAPWSEAQISAAEATTLRLHQRILQDLLPAIRAGGQSGGASPAVTSSL